MNIPDSLVRDFVKIAKEPMKTGGDSTLYGTVVSVSGSGSQREAMVRIDGSEIATPASLGMDAEQDDRVSVLIKNHEAVVNGNITSPASARTATKYMRFTDEGLKIGSFGSSNITSGNYILITDNAYYIKTVDDVTLLSVEADGTRVYGTDGKLKASFLSGGTTLYSPGGLIKLLMNTNGITIYDPTGTKTLATFLADGIKLYDKNGSVLQLASDADGLKLYNKEGNVTAEFVDKGCVLYGRNDGIRIYDSPTVTNVHTRQLLASFIGDGIRLHALVTSGSTTVNRTIAEFLASGISLYNQNGYRMFLADTSGIHLYDDTQTLSAEFLSTGLKLYGQRDGVKIYNSPADATPLSEFGASGVKLHALVETQSGGVIQTTNRILAEFLNTGVKLYNQSGILQTKVDTDGVKLYNKDGEVTAEFVDKGCKLYGRRDGIRIYNAYGDKVPLASYLGTGITLHAIKNGTNVVLAELLPGGLKLYNDNHILQLTADAQNGLQLYNKEGAVTAAFVDKGLKLYGRDDGVRIYDNPTSNNLLASFKSSGVRIHGFNSNNANVILAEFLASGITLNRSDGTPMVKIGNGEIALTNSNGNTASSLGWTALGLADGLAQLIYDDADDVLDITCHGSVTINGNTPANQIDVVNLSSAVSSLSTAVASKASQSSVDTLTDQYNSVVASLSQKAWQSDLSSLATTVNGKASQSSVNTLTNNLNTLLTQLMTLTETGTVTVTASAAANAITLFRGSANVSSGYTLMGIRDIVIKNSNGDRNVHYSLHQFATLDDGRVQVHVHNDTSSAATLTVDIEWFAIRTSFSLS